MRGWSAACAALLLAGCVPADPAPSEPAALDGTCGAPGLQSLVGRPAAVLQTLRLAGPVRIIRPGQAVTKDYSPARLNIAIDADEVIVRVACG